MSGLYMVKAFCREQRMIDAFEDNNERFRAVSTRALIWSGYLMPIMNVINNLTYVFIAVVSGILAARGAITVGMISSFLLYSRQFARPFVDIANIYNNFQTAVAGAELSLRCSTSGPSPPTRPMPCRLRRLAAILCLNTSRSAIRRTSRSSRT